MSGDGEAPMGVPSKKSCLELKKRLRRAAMMVLAEICQRENKKRHLNT
jgi:hypothetical protein